MLHLLSVGSFLIVINQSDYSGVICQFHYCVGWVYQVQSLVKRVFMGPNTQPCDVPVFRIRVQEVRCPISTFWSLSNRKSLIHAHNGFPRPSLLSLLASLCGTIVLNT